MDTAKAIGIIAENREFSDVVSLEGVAIHTILQLQYLQCQLLLVAAGEVTINYVITDEHKDRKMVCVDPA